MDKLWCSINNVIDDLNKGQQQGINSQSLEDTQVGYISQEYTLDNYTLKNTLWLQKDDCCTVMSRGRGNSKVSFCKNTLKINTLLEDICKKTMLGDHLNGLGTS